MTSQNAYYTEQIYNFTTLNKQFFAIAIYQIKKSSNGYCSNLTKGTPIQRFGQSVT